MAGAGVGLALASALLWGAGDYLGGTASRRAPALGVALGAQLVGLVCVGGLALVVGGGLPADALAWGLAAGVVGAVALAFFYAALAAGAMTIVAPLSACGAVIPVGVALLAGEAPGWVGGTGMLLALAGAVLASLGGSDGHPTRLSARALGLSVIAAAGIGAVLALMQQAIDVPGTDALPVVAVMRVGGVAVLLCVVAARRGFSMTSMENPRHPGRVVLALVLGVGLLDATANVFFTQASGEGEDGIVAVLGSLYPITTVALAAFLLRERPHRVQAVGVVAALAGVALISAR